MIIYGTYDMIHRAAGQIKIKLDLSGQLRSYSMASINTIRLMSPFRLDKKDTKANDSDRTCVTTSWFQQCHARVYMPKVGRAVGPHVEHFSRLSSPLVQRKKADGSRICLLAKISLASLLR